MTTAFVGRQRELDHLLSWADEAFAGEPRCVLLRGEAGIGKSRLLDEAAAGFAARALLLRGRCHEAVSIPYLPLSNALTPIITDWSSDRDASAPDSGQTDDRLSLFLRIAEAMRDEVARQPLVLILDDVQWADHASTDLLTHIVTTAVIDSARQPFPLLIVLGLRATVGDEHVAGAIERFRREQFTRELELGPLGRAEVHELVASTAGTPPAQTLLQDLITSSNGNPLMVTWLLQRLDNFGALKMLRGVLVNATGSELVGLPAELDELLRERSAGVSPRCRSLLTTAALLGDDELIDDLEVAIGDAQFSKHFSDALDAGLLVDDGVRYRFAHPQLRQLHYHSPRSSPARTSPAHRRPARVCTWLGSRLRVAHRVPPTDGR